MENGKIKNLEERGQQEMDKVEVIARRILGWKMNSWDKWFDYEKGIFIRNFQPEQKLDHAMLIVEKLEKLGFTYTKKGLTRCALMTKAPLVKPYHKQS